MHTVKKEISIDNNTLIRNGYGEYIVYQVNKKGARVIPEDIYNKAFTIIDRFTARACIKAKQPEKYANRYDLIRATLKKELGKNIEIAFIPRTLYELSFLKKCINEDLKSNEICALYEKNLRTTPGIENTDKVLAYQKKRKCVHQAYFTADLEDNNHPAIRSLAYRLNKSLIKRISADSTFQNILEELKNVIQFYVNHYKNYQTISHSLKGGNRDTPTENFGSRFAYHFMGIHPNNEVNFINEAVILECSELAKNHLIIYRGGKCFKEKSIEYLQSNNENLPKDIGAFSYSYGAGLFSGALYDPGATAYHYMIKIENDAFAIPVPLKQLSDESLFYIPLSHTIAQLLGTDEYFHARTKTWQNSNISGGVQSHYCQEKRDDLLQSNLSKQECIRYYQEAFNNAFVFKKGCEKKLENLFKLFQADKISLEEFGMQGEMIKASYQRII